MSRFGNDIARAIRGLRNGFGKPSFQWNGGTYACVANTATTNKELGLGGFALESDLALFVEAALLPTPGPTEKQTVIYAGKTYRIDHVGILPGGSMVRVHCSSPTKGA